VSVIVEILVIDRKDDCVLANSSFGVFFGIWCSSSQPELKRYAVELDSDDVIAPKLITLSSIKQPCIESRDNVTYLTGLVEEVEDDIMFLRIGTDLVMLEMEHDSNYSRYIGQYVRVELFKLQLYDIGLF
jgi:hypothetical protein